jgi:aminoglycoside phosphotransferase family enzyme/predicted kinase
MRSAGRSRPGLLDAYNAARHAAFREDQNALSRNTSPVGSAVKGAAMTAEDSQQAVIDFLSDPANFNGAPVKRIDTHAASVFLVGDRAHKIKRAVRFSFLDFSTLTKRKAACEAEIALNRSFAPAIYRGVAAITREPNGHLAIGGKGEPVEWSVEMRRFDESQTLDRLADAGQIDESLADALGRAVAGAHRLAPSVASGHFTDVLSEIIAQNEADLTAEPDLFSLEQVRALGSATRDALDRVTPLLQARERAGLVRRCHGDLHLGNIVLIDGIPVVFDALEFNDRIATGDVYYDLAFLLMDLIDRELHAAANIVFNRYLTETRRIHDLDALAALPLFMSIRAAIRAKVNAARNRQKGGQPQLANKAREYAALAQKFLFPVQPKLVAIGGLSGTGKSILAQALAPGLSPLPGAVILRSDVERKALFSIDETEKLPERAYSVETTIRVYKGLAEKARRVTAAGYSAIVDAVFALPVERSEIAKSTNGAEFCGLFLIASLDDRLVRVGNRGRDASDADAEVARKQEEFDLGRIAWSKVDASGTPEETLLRAEGMLKLR